MHSLRCPDCHKKIRVAYDNETADRTYGMPEDRILCSPIEIPSGNRPWTYSFFRSGHSGGLHGTSMGTICVPDSFRTVQSRLYGVEKYYLLRHSEYPYIPPDV